MSDNRFQLDSGSLFQYKGSLFGDDNENNTDTRTENVSDIRQQEQAANAESASPSSDRDQKISILPIDMLKDYKNHPYRVISGAEMETLEESIRCYGIREPLLVRQTDDGHYEIISGHRRKTAALRAGLTNVPAKICVLSDDEAAVAMVDSNLHRSNIFPSEQVLSTKIKYDALYKIYEADTAKSGQKTRDIIGSQIGISGRHLQRILSVATLPPALLDRMDKKKLTMRNAYSISQLHANTINALLPIIERINNETIKTVLDEESSRKVHCEEEHIEYPGLDTDIIIGLLDAQKEGKAAGQKTMRLPEDIYNRFFQGYESDSEVEKRLIEILEEWERTHTQ